MSSVTTPRWAATMGDTLFPEFPWNRLAPLWDIARRHPDGPIDLSVGAPVDPTPAVVRDALAQAASAPGYPSAEGSLALRQAVVDYLARCGGVRCLDTQMVLATIGSKEAIGQLPAFLGLGRGDAVAIPDIAYPTYEIGALAVQAEVQRYLDPMDVDTASVAVMWINSPSNPEGRILEPSELRELVLRARASGTLLVSDECYLDYGWDRPVTSVLHPEACADDPTGLLITSSLSKRSNLAGYRAAFLAGDPTLIARLLQYRRHMGQMVPAPVQAAMTAALLDDEHVGEQRARYVHRRALLKPALEAAGFAIDHSAGGLYFWVRRAGVDCWELADWFARLGIICVPGEVYGESGRQHARLSITITDDDAAAVARRLGAREAATPPAATR